MESKGTPQAGTPQQGSVSGPASSSSTTSTSSQPRSGAKTFQGCLSGDPNNLMLTANGTSYSLQGNTRSLGTMINHQVEVTGDDRNGKAIEVTGARDLGTACSAK
jgi:hypothetical protein